ncbi:hypothetical protein Tco_0428457, partial [Tanacetum coccineum]
MAYTSQGSSSSSSSDSEVHTCSKECLKLYETLQKQYDQQREALKKSNLEIIGYQMGLESLEARIVVHEKNEAVYEEDIAFLNAKDKAGLGYDSQINENEVVHSLFNSRESDVDDSLVNDRFKNKFKKTNEEPANEGERNGQEKDARDQEEALRKQFGQDIERLSGQREATNTDSTNRVNIVSSSVNVVSSSFTTVDPGRERAQRNKFESVFGQDKDTNGNSTYRMFTPINAVGSSYENLGGSILVNVATFPNDDFPTDPLMPDSEDTIDLLNTSIFNGAYDDEDVGVEADLNNLET